jgi:Flp pilus assembly protein TadG
MDDRPSANGSRGEPHRLRAVHRDQRGALATYALRIILAFVLLILVVEEIGQVVNAQIHASNAAGAAAQAGADSYASTKNQVEAEAVALQAMQAADPNAWMVAFSIAKDGTCTVTAYERANSLFIQRLPYLKKFQVQHATESEIHSLATTR